MVEISKSGSERASGRQRPGATRLQPLAEPSLEATLDRAKLRGGRRRVLDTIRRAEPEG